MLTQITAARTSRSIETAKTVRRTAEVSLLFFRRLKDQAINEAKRTRDGLPVKNALLERAWIEQYSAPGCVGWETSFANCCKMLGEDAEEERTKAIKDIDRAWRKALVDWGRRCWQQSLAKIEELKAGDNPTLAARRGVQEELPLERE